MQGGVDLGPSHRDRLGIGTQRLERRFPQQAGEVGE